MFKIVDWIVKDKIKKECHKGLYEHYLEQISFFKPQIDKANSYIGDARDLLGSIKRPNEFIQCSFEYNLESCKKSFSNNSYIDCRLSPSNCLEELKKIDKQKGDIIKEIQKISKQAKQLNDVIDDLKYISKNTHDLNNAYFKIYFDKYKDLCCTYFDLDDFDFNSNVMNI